MRGEAYTTSPPTTDCQKKRFVRVLLPERRALDDARPLRTHSSPLCQAVIFSPSRHQHSTLHPRELSFPSAQRPSNSRPRFESASRLLKPKQCPRKSSTCWSAKSGRPPFTAALLLVGPHTYSASKMAPPSSSVRMGAHPPAPPGPVRCSSSTSASCRSSRWRCGSPPSPRSTRWSA